MNDMTTLDPASIRASITAGFLSAHNAGRKPFAYAMYGEPGGGKSSTARQVAKDCADKGLHFDKVIEINPSFFDPVDIMGTPANDGEVTLWKPPAWLKSLTTGTNLVLIEEISDCTDGVQNLIARIILDNELNGLTLSPFNHFILTGNRATDKSGARKVSGKLGNRIISFAFATDHEQWHQWYGTDRSRDPLVSAFLKKEKTLLHAYEPASQGICPTPRSWEKVGYMLPSMYPSIAVWQANVQGAVGRAAAVAYTGFRKYLADLPSIQEILASPETAPVPTKVEVMYVLITMLARETTGTNFGKVYTYLKRIPKDMRIACINDACGLTDGQANAVKTSPEYAEWLTTEGIEVHMASTY